MKAKEDVFSWFCYLNEDNERECFFFFFFFNEDSLFVPSTLFEFISFSFSQRTFVCETELERVWLAIAKPQPAASSTLVRGLFEILASFTPALEKRLNK